MSKKIKGEVYASFSATLFGKDVRLTVNVQDLDIVTRDNVQNFDVSENVEWLEGIEFESIYEG